ncbi:MAG: hypothetical protein K2I04_00920, partial [Muribaculaceae bacterium]|nr:hypothetical protein [Muribaculaceae bacterium]
LASRPQGNEIETLTRELESLRKTGEPYNIEHKKREEAAAAAAEPAPKAKAEKAPKAPKAEKAAPKKCGRKKKAE